MSVNWIKSEINIRKKNKNKKKQQNLHKNNEISTL